MQELTINYVTEHWNNAIFKSAPECIYMTFEELLGKLFDASTNQTSMTLGAEFEQYGTIELYMALYEALHTVWHVGPKPYKQRMMQLLDELTEFYKR